MLTNSLDQKLVMSDRITDARPILSTVNGEDESGRRSDDNLVEATLKGDDSAYKELLDRHSRRVFAIVGSYFRQPDLREEIAQDVFVKAYFALGTYKGEEQVEAWLARIAVNRCYDELRRRKRRPEMNFTDMSDDESTWLESAVFQSSKAGFVAEQKREIARDLADKLLATLPADDRLVLTMIDGEDCSINEVAELTGWTPGKIKMRAMRARHRLHEKLERLLQGKKTNLRQGKAKLESKA